MKEIEIKAISGIGMIIGIILLGLFTLVTFATEVAPLGILMIILIIFIASGLYVLQPNEGAVMLLFGQYKGTVKNQGLNWNNPFYTKKLISLRTRNLNGQKIKVNDAIGNPIEIAAIITWKIDNTAAAMFSVDNYIQYVDTQSESCLRHLAGLYPYDLVDDSNHLSLRGSSSEVSESLKNELQERLSKAGVIVEDARLSHLAYASEIAAAMLQRQQATAIIAARQKIVEGAVGMVQMALEKLSENGVVNLDEDRKASMVCNLLVVLCGERSTQPIINTGA